MENKQDRRAAIRAYKEADETGGVYRFVNTKTGWKGEPQATPNLKGMQSRWEFTKSVRAEVTAAPDPFWEPQVQAQAREHGIDCIAIEVLETLKKNPDQTAKEFKEDLAQLLALWQEK